VVSSARLALRWAVGPAPSDPVFRTLLRLLEHPALAGREADRSHLGALAFVPGGPDGRPRAILDAFKFLDQFARRHVLPRSSARLTLAASAPFLGADGPRAGEHRRVWGPYFHDLSDPSPFGAARLLGALLEALDGAPLPEGQIRLPHRFGWWDELPGLLARHGRGARLAFERPRGGFVVGRSSLGRTPLGGPEARTRIPDPFSFRPIIL
jgi:hypothetical protein